MCYNSRISIITFSIMAFSSIFLILRNYPNDRWIAIIFIVVGLMQFLEFLMWSDNCGKINHYATVFAYILLMLQPVCLLVGGYFFGNLTFDRKKLLPIIIFYAIFFGIICIFSFIKGTQTRVCSTPDGIHLKWDLEKIYPNKVIFYIAYTLYYVSIALLLFSRPLLLQLFLVALFVGTVLFSVFFVNGPSWKSFWCWTVNFIPVVYIIISFLYYR
jgi:hypothetical protein